ncbi:hypothetical protein GPECTOR_13g769 [Gonium pectorale]|uniref:Uncharacterized protein n=1 Tax=Gonium pectorale TaxID=33097 RepID=A0A150GNH6_GONPE|nr:hypothetical protein GPECTOR_13g769 [Gonium pectorale]|eukprot:KXZ51282.1 hypothetical protein GPECTOR_13g769 [Gonium pectorale]
MPAEPLLKKVKIAESPSTLAGQANWHRYAFQPSLSTAVPLGRPAVPESLDKAAHVFGQQCAGMDPEKQRIMTKAYGTAMEATARYAAAGIGITPRNSLFAPFQRSIAGADKVVHDTANGVV